MASAPHQLWPPAARLSARVGWLASSSDTRRALLQGGIVGLVGLLLGLYVVYAATLPTRLAPIVALAMLAPFAALAVGRFRRLLLGIILLDTSIQFDVHLGYRPEIASFGGLAGWNVSLTTAALGLLYVLWLAQSLARIGPPMRPSLRASVPPLIYLGFVALSGLQARDGMLALFQVWLLLQMLLLYVYVVSAVQTRQDLLFIVALLLVGLLVQGLFILALKLAGPGFSLPGIPSWVEVARGSGGSGSRIGGTSGDPNATAGYLSLLMAPAIGLLLTPAGLWYKRLAVLAFGLGGVGLVFTLSRGGWIATIVSVSLVCGLAWHRRWLNPTLPAVLAILGLLFALIFHDTILARLLGDDQGAAVGRLPLMDIATRMIEDHPLLGVGANNYVLVMRDYISPDLARTWLYTVHHVYLRTWAETGLGGLLAFIAFLIFILVRGARGWMLRDRSLSPIALGLTAAVIGHLVHMNFDVFGDRVTIQELWLIGGLLVAISRMPAAGQPEAGAVRPEPRQGGRSA